MGINWCVYDNNNTTTTKEQAFRKEIHVMLELQNCLASDTCKYIKR